MQYKYALLANQHLLSASALVHGDGEVHPQVQETYQDSWSNESAVYSLMPLTVVAIFI